MNWPRFFSRKHVDWRDAIIEQQSITIQAYIAHYVKSKLEIERLNTIIKRLLTEGVSHDQRGSAD